MAAHIVLIPIHSGTGPRVPRVMYPAEPLYRREPLEVTMDFSEGVLLGSVMN